MGGFRGFLERILLYVSNYTKISRLAPDIMSVVSCTCGHYKCKKSVSRSTRYRHALARVLREEQEAEPEVDHAALPVEEVHDAEEVTTLS